MEQLTTPFYTRTILGLQGAKKYLTLVKLNYSQCNKHTL